MSFDIGRWRVREWFVLGCTVVLLVVSLSDWYGITVRETTAAGTVWRDAATADAWRASTAWTLAIGLAAFAVALWLVHRGQSTQPAWARRTAAGLVVVALGAVGYQFVAMDDLHGTSTYAVVTRPTESVGYPVATTQAYASELTVGAGSRVDRDDLFSGSLDGYRAGPRWGVTAATALFAVLLLAFLTTPTLAPPTGRPSEHDPGQTPPP